MGAVQIASQKRMRGRPRADEVLDSGAIVRAALTAFAQYGWEGTHLRQVAEAAGVDAALIARRFDGKMGLWCAIVDHVSARLSEALEAGGGEGAADAGQRLATVVEHFVRLSLEMPDLGRFFIDQIARPGERRLYAIEKMWLVLREALLPLVEEARRRGQIPAVQDAGTYVASLIGAVAMPLMMRSVALGDMTAESAQTAFMQDIAALFIPGREVGKIA